MTFVEFTIVWRVLLPFLAAFVSAAAGLWLCSLPMRRLPADAHWSEVARRYWPVRMAKSLILIWIVMVAYFEAQAQPHFHHEGWRTFLATMSALAGCLLGLRLAGRGLRLPEVLRRRNPRALPTLLFLAPAGPSILILVGLTWQMGLRMETFVIAGIILLVNLALIMGASVAILKVLGLLREAGEPLQRIARGMAAENGVPLRHVFRIHLAMANAFAFGWTRDLGFTEAILETLDEDELRSVVSHELGHLKESLATRWSRLTGLLIIPTIGLAPTAMVASAMPNATAAQPARAIRPPPRAAHWSGLQTGAAPCPRRSRRPDDRRRRRRSRDRRSASGAAQPQSPARRRAAG